jgi:hypothetical protein
MKNSEAGEIRAGCDEQAMEFRLMDLLEGEKD